MLHKTHKMFSLQWTVFLASLGFFWEAVLFQNLHHIWGNYDNCIITVFIDFPSNSKRDALFHFKPFDYSCTDWEGLHYHLRDVTWEEIFKLVASAAAAESVIWFKQLFGLSISTARKNMLSRCSVPNQFLFLWHILSKWYKWSDLNICTFHLVTVRKYADGNQLSVTNIECFVCSNCFHCKCENDQGIYLG